MIHDKYLEIVKKGLADNKQFAYASKALEYLTAIVIPAFATLMSLYWPDKSAGPIRDVWLALFCGLVAFQFLLIFFRGFKPETPQDLVYLAHQMSLEIDTKNSLIERFKITVDYGATFFQIERKLTLWSHPNLSQSIIRNASAARARLEFMLKEVSNNRYDLFRFTDDLWSFRVYIFNPISQKLVSIAHSHHENHPSYGSPGREWESGSGHVGKAYSDATALITGDAQQVWDFIKDRNNPGNDAHDLQYYKSFASIPILVPEGGREVAKGVVVATSNCLDRFDRSNSLVLEMLAGRIAAILAVQGMEVF